MRSKTVLWLPRGAHTVEPAPEKETARVVHFSGDLQSAGYNGDAIELAYTSNARAYAILDRPPARIDVDGIEVPADGHGPLTLRLPRGQHVVTITTR